MILFIQYPDMERKWFRVTSMDDLNPIFDMFPMTHDIALHSEDLKSALESIAEYLSGHHMSAWVDDKDISKSLRDKALALGLSLTTAISPTALEHKKPSVVPTAQGRPAPERPAGAEFGTHPMDRFLWNIQQIESGGGTNVNHKPIASGKFKGMRAVGRWGLLKPTVDELISRSRLAGTLTPEMQKLETMSRENLDHHFKKNPDVELNLARQLADHVLKRQSGNHQRAAFAWLHGHNMFPSDIDKRTLLHSGYVRKYKAVDKLNPFRASPPTGAVMAKTQHDVDSTDFKMRIKNWYKRRENEITEEPMRSSNFQPDPGRIRDDELDQIKPDSMKNPEERIKDRVKRANVRP